MSLTHEQQMLVEQRIISEGPSVGIAYLLWFFVGLLGVHRFYLGETATGIIMLVLSITGLGLIASIPWAFIDLFLIPDMARARRDALRRTFAYQALNGPTYSYAPYATQPAYPPQVPPPAPGVTNP